MIHPIIGISGSHNIADRQLFVRENYMQSVLRAGGIPVLLPEIEDEETAAQILAHLDGLLLAGGGDIQDIESQKGIPTGVHQQQPPYGEPVHTVHFEKNSLFEQITGTSEMKTNSMHHQAIKDIAPELQIDGQTDDGMIEAVSAKNNSRIFAVQFHPEYLSDHDVYAQKLFAHFVKLACDYQSEKA